MTTDLFMVCTIYGVLVRTRLTLEKETDM